MLERKITHKLVVLNLENSRDSMIALQIYDDIKLSHKSILRLEEVKTFKAFVKVINSFPDIERIDSRPSRYLLRKQQ